MRRYVVGSGVVVLIIFVGLMVWSLLAAKRADDDVSDGVEFLDEKVGAAVDDRSISADSLIATAALEGSGEAQVLWDDSVPLPDGLSISRLGPSNKPGVFEVEYSDGRVIDPECVLVRLGPNDDDVEVAKHSC